jgi:hypothetical protein
MAYLRSYDWQVQIQQLNLNQILNNDSNFMNSVAAYSQEEMTSYLVQKYNCGDEFSDTNAYSNTFAYTGAGRFELNFPTYDPTAVYLVGAPAAVGTNQYICATSNGPGAFQPLDWALVGQQYGLGYYGYPYPRFDYLGFYMPGQRVFWAGSVYQCTQQTLVPDHDQLLQAYRYSNVGPPNAFPGSAPCGYPGTYRLPEQQWTPGTPYNVVNFFQGATTTPAWNSGTAYSAGQFVSHSNTTYPGLAGLTVWYSVTAGNAGNEPGQDIVNWLPIAQQSGDNRSQMLVMSMVDIALYHVHSRISPKNVPELRMMRYKMAMDWLQQAARGLTTPQNLELNQPEYGSRISYGSRIKNINSY